MSRKKEVKWEPDNFELQTTQCGLSRNAEIGQHITQNIEGTGHPIFLVTCFCGTRKKAI